MERSEVLIVVCQHGNEKVGIEVEQQLGSAFDVLIAHPAAVERTVRFIESDLNRSFPGQRGVTIEESLAAEVLERTRAYALIIDVHSTTSSVELFGIAANQDPRIVEIARRMGLSHLVFMPEELASRSLIGNVPLGISLEVGPHDRKENADDIVRAVRSLFTSARMRSSIDVYEVFEAIRGSGTPHMENFVYVPKGSVIASNGSERIRTPFGFYPVLVCEEAYDGQLALAARMIENT